MFFLSRTVYVQPFIAGIRNGTPPPGGSDTAHRSSGGASLLTRFARAVRKHSRPVSRGIGNVIFASAVLCIPSVAHAYVGPGAGLGVIAVSLAVVLGVFLILVGFLWYPLKRLLSRNKISDGKSAPAPTEED